MMLARAFIAFLVVTDCFRDHLTSLSLVEAWGEGPIGVHAIDGEHVVVADSDANALILINHVEHRVVDRRSMDNEFYASASRAHASKLFGEKWNDPPEPGIPLPHLPSAVAIAHPQLISFATCPTCNFGIVSAQWIEGTTLDDPRFARHHRSSGAMLLKIDFERPLAQKLEGMLSSGAVTKLPLGSVLRSGGMLAMSPDGSRAYIADREAKCIWAFDPRNVSTTTPQSAITSLVAFPIPPRSLSLSAAATTNELLVTLRRNFVVRVNLASLAKCFIRVPAKCNREANQHSHYRQHSEAPHHQPHRGLCEAVMHSNGGRSTLLVLTHFHGRGGTLVELTGPSCDPPAGAVGQRSTSCRLLAGNSSTGSGWRDGPGEVAQFTRPHSMVSVTSDSYARPTVILTDIDNRALRKVSLQGSGIGSTDVSSIVYTGRQTVGRVLWSSPSSKSSGVLDMHTDTWEGGRRRCSERGARLCDLDDMIAPPAAVPPGIPPEDAGPSRLIWTSLSCESCWHPKPGICGCKVPLDVASGNHRLLLEDPSGSVRCPAPDSGTCEGNYECKWGGGLHVAVDTGRPTTARCMASEAKLRVRCCPLRG